MPARNVATRSRTTTRRRSIPRKPSDKAEGMEVAREGMASSVATILDDRDLTQTEAAFIMKDAPSQISLVVTGKLRGFSTERLLRMLARLGRDIDIKTRKAKGKHGKIRFIEE